MRLLLALALSIVISTLVLFLARFARSFILFVETLPMQDLCLYMFYKMPYFLGYTLPFSTLIATLFVFNQMSNDQEITAMRSSGLSLLQISSPAIFIALLLSLFCAYLQCVLAPQYNRSARQLMESSWIRNPATLLEANQTLTFFPGYHMIIGEKDDSILKNIHLYILDDGKVRQSIIAEKGRVTVDRSEQRLTLILSHARIITNTQRKDRQEYSYSQECSVSFDYGKKRNDKELMMPLNELTLMQLLARRDLYKNEEKKANLLLSKLHLRLALSCAPFSFILLAIPLGLQMQRRESPVGFITVILVVFFYFSGLKFIDTMQAYSSYPLFYLLWLPNLCCQGLGLWGLWKKR